MYKILVILFISLFFVSCGPKNSAFMYFEKKDVETKGVQFTKKVDIIKDKEVDVIFISTYLNKIDNKISNTKNEVFLVSLFFANADIQDIEKNGYKLLLNENEPIWLEKVEKNDKRFKDLMLKNYWGNYYLVKFNSVDDSSNLKLELSNEESSKVILNFEK